MLHSIVISRGLAQDDRWEYESALAGLCVAQGFKVLIIPHLYHLREGSPIWARLAAEAPFVLAAWLYPRPAEWLLEKHNVPASGIKIVCLGDFATPDQALTRIISTWSASSDGVAEATAPSLDELTEPTPERWYPVLDRSRCSDCGQCHQFCLFGVFGLDASGRVVVENPDLCKPGCPACSRICPEGAIMFPLYSSDEAIAGAPGRFMAPDEAARKMFELRVKGVLPPEARGGETPKPPVPEIIRDDLDSLLDDLDKL